MTRVVVIGNSGSGKSTYAVALARAPGVAHFDLDTIAWQPTRPPRRRPLDDSRVAIDAFVDAHRDWVIEGCYADLLELVLPRCDRLVLLNPGVEACIANCRARPWEPHKYPSREAQDRNLPMLLDWVSAYGTRDDECSLASHRRLFDGFGGDKREYTGNVPLPATTP